MIPFTTYRFFLLRSDGRPRQASRGRKLIGLLFYSSYKLIPDLLRISSRACPLIYAHILWVLSMSTSKGKKLYVMANRKTG
jgi:hypothetical protein